jgi:hypothetical protein
MHPYASAEYAAAFLPLEAIWLPNARTHVLRRSIPGTGLFDAMGCYPICVFAPSDCLQADFDLLANRGIVSLVLVTDCLTQPDEPFLQRHFDLCRPYKTHYLFDATLPEVDFSKHHRAGVRRASRKCETRVVNLGDYLSDWMTGHENLVRRKRIIGIQNFSRSYFERLAMFPQVTTIAAFANGVFVAGHICISDQERVYVHLAAATDLGRKLESAFVLCNHEITLFRAGHVIDFGGGAGVQPGETDGLIEFKKGFTNTEKRNFLCGKILDRDAYQTLSAARDPATNFFPAYRTAL